jgi:Predicted transcriptional regulators
MKVKHMETPQELGTFLRELRLESGKSVRVLAKLTGLNPASLGQWERGEHWPSVYKLGQLLRWYGETVTVGQRPSGKEET